MSSRLPLLETCLESGHPIVITLVVRLYICPSDQNFNLLWLITLVRSVVFILHVSLITQRRSPLDFRAKRSMVKVIGDII